MQKVSSGHYPRRNPESQSKLEKGFYYISLKAQVPIVLIGIDYEKEDDFGNQSHYAFGRY